MPQKKPFQCVQIMTITDGTKRRSSALRTTCSFIMLPCSLMKIIKRDHSNQKFLFISSIKNNLKNDPEGWRMAKTFAYSKYFNSSFIKFIPGNQCILFFPPKFVLNHGCIYFGMRRTAWFFFSIPGTTVQCREWNTNINSSDILCSSFGSTPVLGWAYYLSLKPSR